MCVYCELLKTRKKRSSRTSTLEGWTRRLPRLDGRAGPPRPRRGCRGRSAACARLLARSWRGDERRRRTPRAPGPASSCRKCPAFAIVGCSRPCAPGMHLLRGSVPCPGDRVAVGERHEDRRADAASAAQAARFASLAGSSGVIGTSPGIARGPALKRLVRERRVVAGAHLVAHRPHAAGLHEAADVDARRASGSTSRNWCQISGIGVVAGGQPGVRGDDAGEALRVLGGQPQPDEPAPVLPDQRDAAAGRARPRPARAPTRRAGRRCGRRCVGRLVRAAEADEVGRDRRAARRRRAPGSSCGTGTTTTARRAAAAPVRRRPGRPRPTPSAACRRPGRRRRVARFVVEVGQVRRSTRRGPQRLHGAKPISLDGHVQSSFAPVPR